MTREDLKIKNAQLEEDLKNAKQIIESLSGPYKETDKPIIQEAINLYLNKINDRREMKSDYDFDIDKMLYELQGAAFSHYMTHAQYMLYQEERRKVVNEFNSKISWFDNHAKENTIGYMENELKEHVHNYPKHKTISDLEKYAEEQSYGMDGPSAWHFYQDQLKLIDFCKKYKDIAKKYLENVDD